MIEISCRHNQIAVLLDPEKLSGRSIPYWAEKINEAKPDYVFLGGSTFSGDIDPIASHLKQHTHIPIVLFPGNNKQLTRHADGLLLLSLISSRNADMLIGQHVEAAPTIREYGLQVISTGYILIDAGRESATQRVSCSMPIQRDNIQLAVNTALAAELLGMQAVYLEAGSGALQPVPQDMIRQVKKTISIPLIVGGGLKNHNDIHKAIDGGADLVVIGNHFEQNPDEMADFCDFVHSYNK